MILHIGDSSWSNFLEIDFQMDSNLLRALFHLLLLFTYTNDSNNERCFYITDNIFKTMYIIYIPRYPPSDTNQGICFMVTPPDLSPSSGGSNSSSTC